MAAPIDSPAPHARHRPLNVGVFLPLQEGSAAGATPRWVTLLARAQCAEAVGFDSVWLPDHLLFRWAGQEDQGAWECWSLVAALAATTRLTIGTLVACTGYRNPALLAKVADTVDEISGGRLILGLGAGYHEPEFRAFGLPHDHLVGRFAEALPLIATLLREGRADFQGRYYQARECELRPRGPRPGGPPIMVGAHGARVLRLAARHADLANLWLPWQLKDGVFVHNPDQLAALDRYLAMLNAACIAEGRDPATLGRTVTLRVHPPGWDLPPVALGTVTPIGGSAEAIAATLRGLAARGVGHVQLTMPGTVAALEAFAPVLDLLDREPDTTASGTTAGADP